MQQISAHLDTRGVFSAQWGEWSLAEYCSNTRSLSNIFTHIIYFLIHMKKLWLLCIAASPLSEQGVRIYVSVGFYYYLLKVAHIFRHPIQGPTAMNSELDLHLFITFTCLHWRETWMVLEPWGTNRTDQNILVCRCGRLLNTEKNVVEKVCRAEMKFNFFIWPRWLRHILRCAFLTITVRCESSVKADE